MSVTKNNRNYFCTIFKSWLQIDVVDGSKFHDSHMGTTNLNIPSKVQNVLSTHWTFYTWFSTI